jgi:phosphohistidine swiveling domain-containing protein
MTIAIVRSPSRRVRAYDTGFTRPLSRPLEAREAGEKAANLSRLLRSGHPVPEGFVLTNAALDAFLAGNGLVARIDQICEALDPRALDGVQAASTAIAGLIRGASLPVAVATDLDLALAGLPPQPVIVRSSAVGEDSGDASFAGQLDSIADVMGASQVRRALLDVWASRWSTRSLSYQLARGKQLSGMGVIVQRQIASAISGVLFTAAPGRPDEMLVEYCGGTGEALVSGRVNPGRLVISRRDLGWALQTHPEQPADAATLFLEPARIASLARRALELERVFGLPQDIEWTMDGEGRIWIVQARPITVSARPASAPGAKRAGRPVVWSNANVNENFPEPISPLLYSIARRGYYHYFRNLGRAFGFTRRRIASMEEPLQRIIGVQGARMYYNLTSIHGVLRSAPFGELLAAWFNQFTGAEQTDAPAIVRTRRTDSLARQAGELAAIAVRTAWQYVFVTRRVERFERTAAAFAERTRPTLLETRSRRELLDDFRAFLDIRYNRWKDASLADTAAMVCYGALKRALNRALPSADQASIHNSLLKALPGLPSSVPGVKLWDLSRLVRANARLRDRLETTPAVETIAVIRHDPQFADFNAELERFLDDWGFRCSGELMLTVASFQEAPAPLVDIIKAYAGRDEGSPAEHLLTQRRDRLADTARVATVLRTRRLHRFVPFLHEWHVVSVLLRWTQHAIVLRERARLKQALLYSRLRRVALALGARLVEDGLLDDRTEIFWLTADEIDDLVSGSAMFPHHLRPLVEVRRAAHAELGAAAPPDSLTLGEDDYWQGASDRQVPLAQRSDALGPRTLQGLGVCGGTATARAAVLTDVTEAHRLQPGDVLITRQTDPGWGAVFPLISGLVMERGGMLSHGAIIAREFGIPSVVGIAEATRAVPHGTRVAVDGDRGLVQILSAPVDSTSKAVR